MRRLMSGAMILAAALALGPLQVAAQQGRRAGARQAPGRIMRPMGAQRMGRAARPGVEGIMRMRERLKLTDNQFKRLDAIRAGIVRQRVARLARMAELRSRVMAGEATRGTLVDSMTAWRKAAVAAGQEQRTHVEGILTQTQKDTLESLVARRRAFAAGRASALRGMRRGMWRGRGPFMGGRGAMWNRSGRGGAWGGMPGPRMAPGGGPGWRGGGAGRGPTAPPVRSPLPDSAGSGGGGS